MKPDMMEEGCPCTGKNLDRLLQPSILLFLTQNELHGFLLVKKLGESPMFGGVYPDPSGLYRYLKKMQANGLLDSYTDPQKDAPDRTIYRITDHGRECLGNWLDTLLDYDKRVNSLIDMIRDTIGNNEQE